MHLVRIQSVIHFVCTHKNFVRIKAIVMNEKPLTQDWPGASLFLSQYTISYVTTFTTLIWSEICVMEHVPMTYGVDRLYLLIYTCSSIS